MFGTEAYVHIPEPKRTKMESKSQKLKFVGYSMDQKAYRFVDCETDLITVSRDARFIELGNGTSTVEFPMSISSENRPTSVQEEIKLLPLIDPKKE